MNNKLPLYYYNIYNNLTNLYSYYFDVLSSQECDLVCSDLENLVKIDGSTMAQVRPEGSDIKSNSDRKGEICFIPSNEKSNAWLFERCSEIVKYANDQWFKFDVNSIESLQLSEYKEGDYFKPHLDLIYDNPSKYQRKLSFSIQLSDPEEYEGGDLILNTIVENKWTAPKSKGCVTIFPSFVAHEVTPVTRGVRKSLVGWVLGPNFK